MKKLLFVMTLIIGVSTANSAYAKNMTRKDFAQIISPIICNSGDNSDIVINDIANPSEEVLDAVALGIIKLDENGNFKSSDTVYPIEFYTSIVKAWEIRMGRLEASALGHYIEEYDSMSEEEKNVLDKAVMLGIIPIDGKIKTYRPMSTDNASQYVQQVIKTTELMKNHGVSDIITAFRDEQGVTGVPDGKITFYATLNEPAQYNDTTLVMALYSDGKLVDVSRNSYTDLQNADFTIMHTSLEIQQDGGDMKVKAFILDSLRSLKPIYEYKIIR